MSTKQNFLHFEKQEKSPTPTKETINFKICQQAEQFPPNTSWSTGVEIGFELEISKGKRREKFFLFS